jgi:hypothetical protein
MRSAATMTGCPRPRAAHCPGRAARAFGALIGLLLCAVLLGLPGAARAGPELTGFEIGQTEDGVVVNYAVDFELPRGAEEALNKAVPLYFVAEAEVYRERWYWRDKRVGSAVRVWRIVYQPLTLSYRVTFAGLSQSYATRAEAFAAIKRGVNWKVAEVNQVEDGGRHYVEFNFRLDTSLLPRPMQIGIGNAPDWALSVEHFQRLN